MTWRPICLPQLNSRQVSIWSLLRRRELPSRLPKEVCLRGSDQGRVIITHQFLLHFIEWCIYRTYNNRVPFPRIALETGSWKPAWHVDHCPIINQLSCSGFQNTWQQIHQGIASRSAASGVDPMARACSIFSESATYGSFTGSTSIPYATDIITCPVMLSVTIKR